MFISCHTLRVLSVKETAAWRFTSLVEGMTWRLFILTKVSEPQKDSNLSLNSCRLSLPPLHSVTDTWYIASNYICASLHFLIFTPIYICPRYLTFTICSVYKCVLFWTWQTPRGNSLILSITICWLKVWDTVWWKYFFLLMDISIAFIFVAKF